MKLFNQIALACAMSAGGLAIAPSGAAAQESAGYLANETELARLVAVADDLINRGAQDAAGRREVVAAIEAVIDAAQSLHLPDETATPALGRARIKLAAQLYASGENARSQALVEQGLEGISGYLPEFLVTHAEGTALLGVILAQAGKAAAAREQVAKGLAIYVDAFEQLTEADRTRGVVVARSNLEFSLSQVLSRLGEVEESLEFQKASLATREAGLGRNDSDTISSYYGLALALNRAGRTEEAETAARAALELAVENIAPSHPSYARAQEALGIVLSRTGRPIEATDFLLSSIALKREHEGTQNLVFGYAVHNLASIFLQRERYADALPLFREAAPIFASFQGDDSPYGLGSSAYVGQILYAEGNPAEAVNVLDEVANSLAKQEGDTEIRLRVEPDLVRALAETGQRDRAAALARSHYEAVRTSGEIDPLISARARLLDAHFGQSPDTQREAAYDVLNLLSRTGRAMPGALIAAPERAALDLVMENAVTRNDASQMLAAMNLAGESDLASATRNRLDRQLAATPDASSAIRDVQTLAADADAAYRDWLGALMQGVGTDQAREDYERAQANYQDARQALRDQSGSSHSDEKGAAPDVAQIMAGLDPDEGVLAVIPAYSNTYLLALTREEAVVARAPLGRAAIVELANRLGSALRAGGDDPDAALELAQAIFTPRITEVLTGIDELGVFTKGALSSLPFATLRIASGDSATWAGDRFALASLSTLDAMPDAGLTSADQSQTFVSFAAPAPFRSDGVVQDDDGGAIADYFTRGGIDTGRLAALPRLDNALPEARAIASLFRPALSTIFTGSQASESSVHSSQVTNADILLFAVHGLVAGEVEGVAQPSLVMAAPDADLSATGPDGVLTADEIAMLHLNADWVILSSCNSAAGMAGGLSAFSGLASAFRQAGANTLLVTHWPVRDDVSAAIVTETLRNHRSGMSKRAALRAAQQKVRQRSDLSGSGNPWTWAPFVIVE